MLHILALFSQEHPVISVDFVCAELAYPQASAYRYIKELLNFGLLVRTPSGYALGPRVIELDRLKTAYDPILINSGDLIERLVDQTGLSVLVSEFYDNTVINIFQAQGKDPDLLNFGRGHPIALFKSATAKIILAHLLPRQLKRVFEMHLADAHSSRLGSSWKEFSRAMHILRKQGYCISSGELDADKAGIAAPIFDEKTRIIGSITLVGTLERFNAYHEAFLADLIVTSAQTISGRISDQGVQ